MKLAPTVLSALAVLTLVTTAQAAPTNLSNYTFVAGGFGKDGATSEPTPLKNSSQNAKKIFDALEVAIDDVGYKSAGFNFDGDHGLSCNPSGCQITVLIANQRLDQIGFNESIRFGGTAAEAIFEALPKSSEFAATGATTRTVANLSCTRSTARGFPVACTSSNINYSATTLSLMEKQGIPRAHLEALIKAAGLK